MKPHYFLNIPFVTNVLLLLSLLLAVALASGSNDPLLLAVITTALALVSVNLVICARRSVHLGRMRRKLDDATVKGLATAIEMTFEVPKSGEFTSIFKNLNAIFNETKRVFWDIRENLFETKIHYSILEKMKLVMVSYIQKVVNIGNVRQKLDSICARIGDTTASVRGIIGSIVDLANKTDEEAAAITQSSEALEKLFSVISKVTAISGENARMANELERTTRAGGERVDETLSLIRKLDAGTGEMLSVIGIIDDIAESTNLLSINAGIEAAHSGAAGKGFRVIADEIMKLVVSTKKNAGNISAMLKDQVRNIGAALKESSESGTVFRNVNSEVEGAVRTWSEISESIAEMSRDTKLLNEATTRLMNITNAVSESSAVIRASIEKIEKEIVDLDSASDETVSILEKITTEGSEEQKSTMEVLQQLGKVTKFVVNLNKAIDFFNIGKKIFFLFPETDACRAIMGRIVEEEYEVFAVGDHRLVPKLLRESPNSIVFINHEGKKEPVQVEEILQSIGKKTSIKNMHVFSLTYDPAETAGAAQPGGQVEQVVLSRGDGEGNVRKVLALLVRHNAKGLRKYIRVECRDKDGVRVLPLHAAGDTGARVLNLSSSAILCERKGLEKIASVKKRGEMALVFGAESFRVSFDRVVEKDENHMLVILDLEGNPVVKRKIGSYIYGRLQDKLAEEIAMIHD